MSQPPRPGTPTTTLTASDIQAIAEATALRLSEIVSSGAMTFGLVGARQLARELGVSLDYVYAHVEELGGMRLGSGPKAHIRFDLDRARSALEARTDRRARKAARRRARAASRH